MYQTDSSETNTQLYLFFTTKSSQFEYCRSGKNTLGKLAVTVNAGGLLIRLLNERSVSDGGNLCPLWLVILRLV